MWFSDSICRHTVNHVRYQSCFLIIDRLIGWLVCACVCCRLQDVETQYRKEKEEADLLLEQHRLVSFSFR